MRLLSFFVLFIALASAVCASPHPFPHPSFPSGGETTSRGFEDSSSAPAVTGFSTLMGPPGQWLYVYGSNFLTGPGNTSLYLVSALSPDSISNPVPLHVYDSNSFGFTDGKSEPSKQVFAIGVPINPPTVRGFSRTSGGNDCWLYVYGDNFVVGQTQVHIGGVIPTSVAIYDTQSIGLTVPKLLKCAAEPVTVTVETPNGKATSTATYTVLPNQSGGFC
ncbi:prepeptidase C-terminal domain containing protein [Acanthamoeba castellanii str. Neff]|uniref:Prepeptidase C-terminal domain containing protein n=1 Tax=Acanthamoeba castellanii (strain ATCC 30010 / Neff) TaxID=1257118 RepID=L8GZQ0_ACACF|nr:prepeptidase C-terminal domain containing protein [Acanthamoeba castellanii str. Neff]ELR17576.1 prepeptidase C-terminal domain containing protein [Acanthamoeba castellanii str. Neff]